MLIGGAHSQAKAELDVQHRRSDAHAIRAATGAMNTLPPEFQALVMGNLDNIRGINKEIISARRTNKFMPKSMQTNIPELEEERDQSSQLILDIGAAFRQGGFGQGGGRGRGGLPTITADAAGQAAYNRLDSGEDFIDPNGDVQTKP